MSKTKFRRWREAAGLTQGEVALLLDLGAIASVYAYDTAMYCPNPVLARRIQMMTKALGPFTVTAMDMQRDWEAAHPADETAFEIRLTRFTNGQKTQQKDKGKDQGQRRHAGAAR